MRFSQQNNYPIFPVTGKLKGLKIKRGYMDHLSFLFNCPGKKDFYKIALQGQNRFCLPG